MLAADMLIITFIPYPYLIKVGGEEEKEILNMKNIYRC